MVEHHNAYACRFVLDLETLPNCRQSELTRHSCSFDLACRAFLGFGKCAEFNDIIKQSPDQFPLVQEVLAGWPYRFVLPFRQSWDEVYVSPRLVTRAQNVG